MSKEKQIEEMAVDMCLIDRCKHLPQAECHNTTCAHCEAEALYNAGYRKQEWISVDERLPERQGYYLGRTYKGLMMIAPFFPVYADDKPEFRYDISHWMPLPEAPKMKGGAE